MLVLTAQDKFGNAEEEIITLSKVSIATWTGSNVNNAVFLPEEALAAGALVLDVDAGGGGGGGGTGGGGFGTGFVRGDFLVVRHLLLRFGALAAPYMH